ncbi:hypothetical protein KAX97_14060 [candidate division WOR-3 bacterium]|nr:hypothetical protein [candidate division WOR-3 bacterium]
MPSERIEGWTAIAEYFPQAYSTFQKYYAQDMLKAGYAFKSHVQVGRTKKNL